VIGMAEKNKQRDQRHAAALRENLKRRKAQARALNGKVNDKGGSKP